MPGPTPPRARRRYLAAWAAVLEGALAERRANVIVALIESGLDLRCPLAPGGPPVQPRR
jgi:hypothetical protein